MFHYTAPGSHTYTGTRTNYFSANGGTTNLDNFNSDPDGDLGDWAGSAGTNSFLAFSPTDEADVVSQSDLTAMNALGYSTGPVNGIVVAASGTDAVQGGAAVALLSAPPVITDSSEQRGDLRDNQDRERQRTQLPATSFTSTASRAARSTAAPSG